MKVTLPQENLNKWLHNLMIFMIPVISLYILQVVGTLSLQNHLIEFKDLIPSQVTIGGMVLYLFNGVLDILRKLQTEE